jgi:hypothetical protein
MPAIVRPKQSILFSDRPRGLVQADLLDAQIHNLVQAIHSTQVALEEIRRDDGKLKNNIVGRDQLEQDIKHSRSEMDSVEQRVLAAAQNAVEAVGRVVSAGRDVDFRANDAEAAAVSAAKSLSAVTLDSATAFDAASDADNSADRAESAAIQSENWSNHSLANSDNAIAAKNEATQWAEYLAGPVVDPNAAPAYIQNHPYGHGLYYQPVQGGVAGLWSAKWWALYAQNLVGNVGFYYLGPSDSPPIPGGQNPVTGQAYPNPIAPGSFYYDTSSHPPQVMFWNGAQWMPPNPNVTAGYLARFYYTAAAGQTVFSGNDNNGVQPSFTTEGHNVHVNGVRLVPDVDFTIDNPNQSMSLIESVPAGSSIQWDLLIPGDKVNSAALDAFKIETLTPNGSQVSFNLSYIDPASSTSTPTEIGTGSQLQVSLDGVIQEPAVDYTAIGSVLTMATPPPVDSKLWAVWYRPHVQQDLP